MGVPTVTASGARRRELGLILRSYRDRVGPREVGLPDGGRRRAPGLRREEVATLSGVGLTWYTWLEQGRVTASDDVLDAVGRVLGIDEAGRRHLRLLSRQYPDRRYSDRQNSDRQHPDPPAADVDGLRPLLDGWASGPAALLDGRLGVVAANDAWTSVWGPSAGWHVLSVVTGDPHADVGDPQPLVQGLARRFRMVCDLDPTDPELARVRAGLRDVAPAFGAVWDCRGVGEFGRPRIRVDGVERVALLLGECGPAGLPAPSVLVLPGLSRAC